MVYYVKPLEYLEKETYNEKIRMAIDIFLHCHKNLKLLGKFSKFKEFSSTNNFINNDPNIIKFLFGTSLHFVNSKDRASEFKIFFIY